MPSEILAPVESNGSSPVTTTSDQSSLTPGKSSRKSSMIGLVKNFGSFTSIENITNFFRRKDSVLARDSPPQVSSPNSPNSRIPDSPHDFDQVSSASAENGTMAYEGMAHFSNVSQFFNKRGTAGESSYWYTTDEYLSLQNSPVEPITPTSATNLEADAQETRRQDVRKFSRDPTTRQEQPLQKSLLRDVLDIMFSWLSRRPSKKSKGKRPEPRNDPPSSPPLPLSAPQDIPVPRSYVRLTSSTPSSVEDLTFTVRDGRPDIWEASYLNSVSSEPLRLPLVPSLPWVDSTTSLPIPNRLLDDNQAQSPPPGPPEVLPYSSNESLSTSSTSLSSLGEPDHRSRSTGHVHPNVLNYVASSSSNVGAEGRSMPIDIPTPNNGSRRSSTISELTARPPDHHYLPTSCVPVITEPLWNASAIIYERRSDCPIRAPPSPDLLPISRSVSSDIQSLDLPSPRRPIIERSDISTELVFPLTAVPSEEDLAEHKSPPAASSEQQNTPVGEEDRPDFSLTHAAPPDEPVTSHSRGTKRPHPEGETQSNDRRGTVEQSVGATTKSRAMDKDAVRRQKNGPSE